MMGRIRKGAADPRFSLAGLRHAEMIDFRPAYSAFFGYPTGLVAAECPNTVLNA
jgi:hypothetical protein